MPISLESGESLKAAKPKIGCNGSIARERASQNVWTTEPVALRLYCTP
jgi:hypothetical protein